MMFITDRRKTPASITKWKFLAKRSNRVRASRVSRVKFRVRVSDSVSLLGLGL